MFQRFDRRPYLDPRIDRWKVSVLWLLFLLFLLGALTWVDRAPWEIWLLR